MTGHESGAGAEVLRKGHRAFNDRDRDALFSALAEDITWHVDGNGPSAGTHQGHEAVWQNFFAPLWEAPVRVEDHDILDNGDHAVAVATLIVDSGGQELRWKGTEVVHVEDGKITERWAFRERQEELDDVARQMSDQPA